MKPKVSIVIPVYNGEKSIGISLKSLLEQTDKNFEAIIVDDGSKDKTKDITLEHIKLDSRFKYFFQENAGVSAARNKGTQLATGEFITFLDSDDFYEKTFIEKMVNKIESESADVCYCGYNIVSPNKSKIKKTKFRSKDLLLDYILGRVSIHTTGWMIRKKLIEEFDIKFPEGISWGEDFEFFCEVLSHSKKNTCVKEYLTNYRVEFEENRLSNFSMDKLDKDFISIQRIAEKLDFMNDNIIEKALLSYRLQALLVYRLLLAFQFNVSKEEILNYYEKYKIYLKNNNWNNGIRSVKLNFYKRKLFMKIGELN
ncbi:glycosyltransferase family 2 protein [Alkalithermobacter paradoxus]|uniref:Putative glycosyltransferase EpsH n=1 Tax=Alkalithermobacter paradoxus TaxID=29349 RepID=A0A1V4I5Z3_9FIRM|nr:putative glycosyltransferase EpsH [[Clostridium] thermoalcaliphilum]